MKYFFVRKSTLRCCNNVNKVYTSITKWRNLSGPYFTEHTHTYENHWIVNTKYPLVSKETYYFFQNLKRFKDCWYFSKLTI